MEIEVPFPWGRHGAGFVGQVGNENFAKLRSATAPKLIDFDDDKIELREGIVRNTWFLHVGGTQPYYNMRVELVPLMYVKQPEYWEIQLVGTLLEVGLPATKPFNVALLLGPFIGKKGIEVVGGTKRKKLDIPPQQ